MRSSFPSRAVNIVVALLVMLGAGCAYVAATRHYTDAGFVVNVLYELLAAALVGLAVVVWTIAFVLHRRKRQR